MNTHTHTHTLTHTHTYTHVACLNVAIMLQRLWRPMLMHKTLSVHVQEHQTGTQMATEACGFSTIVIGTFLLHATREMDVSLGEHCLPRATLSAHHKSVVLQTAHSIMQVCGQCLWMGTTCKDRCSWGFQGMSAMLCCQTAKLAAEQQLGREYLQEEACGGVIHLHSFGT